MCMQRSCGEEFLRNANICVSYMCAQGWMAANVPTTAQLVPCKASCLEGNLDDRYDARKRVARRLSSVVAS